MLIIPTTYQTKPHNTNILFIPKDNASVNMGKNISDVESVKSLIVLFFICSSC